LKRGLFGVNPILEELHGEYEACLIARARARLLLALADCSAMLPSDEGGLGGGAEGGGRGGDGVAAADMLRRVRDAADCMLGEVLQVNGHRCGMRRTVQAHCGIFCCHLMLHGIRCREAPSGHRRTDGMSIPDYLACQPALEICGVSPYKCS